jgi:hypothetical protein
MPSTTPKGLRYPQAGDNPAVHTDIQNLATDIDTALNGYISTAGITSLVFEGVTNDTAELTLTTVDPTVDRTITLPDATGTVMLRDASETMSNKTLGSNLVAGSYKITGLGDASESTDTDAVNVKVAFNIARTTGFLLGGM